MKHIFVVEDRTTIRESIGSYLELSGYSVSLFPLISEAQTAFAHTTPDLLIQDVMMSDGDGFSFVKQLRTRYAFPIVFVTARNAESDRIMGFELGCDDYLVKPFSPKELILRVEAIFRRVEGVGKEEKASESEWVLGSSSLKINEVGHAVSLDGHELELTAAEWRILMHLISHAGSVVSRAQILESCFSYTFESYDRIVDTHIKNIRSKIGSSSSAWVETVRGYGYKFAGTHPRRDLRCLQ